MNRREMLARMLGGLAVFKTLPPLPPYAGAEDERYWELFREYFLMPDGVVYLNNGSLGVSPWPVIQAMYGHLLQSEKVEGRKLGEQPWWGYGPSLEYRQRLAAFLGAQVSEVALTRNATEGMNTVGTGLDLNAGDEVLISDQEHPGGKSVWYQRAKRCGIVVREFGVPKPPQSQDEILNRINDAITPRTRVVSISHITTVTGGMLPVQEICRLARDQGIISVIDGAHAIGQVPLDLHDLGCDYYATSPHKWLLAPKGTGILYCREGMAERLWCHTASGTWDKPELGCERLTNIGTSNVTLLEGLVAAMEFHETIGRERLAERMRFLNRFLRQRISAIPGVGFWTGPPPMLSTAMAKVTLPVQKMAPIAERLWQEHKIWLVSEDGNEGSPATIRFSCHAYIRPGDLERCVELLGREMNQKRMLSLRFCRWSASDRGPQ